MRSPIALAVLLALATAIPARAAWLPDGVKLTPPLQEYESRSLERVVADGTGGAYLVWESRFSYPFTDGEGVSMIAQQVDILGNRPAGWPANGTTFSGWNTASFGVWGGRSLALVSDGAGGAVHALLTSSLSVEPHNNFNLHHLLPNGTVPGFPYYAGDHQGDKAHGVAVDGDGAGGVVAILSGQTFAPPVEPRGPSPLYAKRIAGDGSVVWGDVELTTPGTGGPAAALHDGAGGGYFLWFDTREAGDIDLYLQHLDGAGAIAAGWPAGGLLVAGAPGTPYETQLAPDGAGGVFVAWRHGDGDGAHFFVHHVLASGALDPALPPEGRLIPSTDAEDPLATLVSDGAGGCYVYRLGRASFFEYHGALHRLDAALLPRAGWPATGIALPSSGGIAVDVAGGAFVSYRNATGPAPSQGLFVQHFAGDGTPAPGWAPQGFRLSGTGFPGPVVRSGSGAIIVWTDTRADAPGIYAQRVVTDGPVAVQMALVSAVADAGRAALHWYAPDGANLAVRVERRTGTSGWSRLAELAADPGGHVRYDDAAVEPGVRYAYRLAWTESDGAHTTAESWLEIPGRVGLAIESPRPNPSAVEVSLAVSLPAAAPARIDVLDLAGRRVASLDLALGAGRHVVALPGAASLAAGVYVVQLAQAGDVRRTRLLRVN